MVQVFIVPARTTISPGVHALCAWAAIFVHYFFNSKGGGGGGGGQPAAGMR